MQADYVDKHTENRLMQADYVDKHTENRMIQIYHEHRHTAKHRELRNASRLCR